MWVGQQKLVVVRDEEEEATPAIQYFKANDYDVVLWNKLTALHTHASKDASEDASEDASTEASTEASKDAFTEALGSRLASDVDRRVLIEALTDAFLRDPPAGLPMSPFLPSTFRPRVPLLGAVFTAASLRDAPMGGGAPLRGAPAETLARMLEGALERELRASHLCSLDGSGPFYYDEVDFYPAEDFGSSDWFPVLQSVSCILMPGGVLNLYLRAALEEGGSLEKGGNQEMITRLSFLAKLAGFRNVQVLQKPQREPLPMVHFRGTKSRQYWREPVLGRLLTRRTNAVLGTEAAVGTKAVRSPEEEKEFSELSELSEITRQELRLVVIRDWDAAPHDAVKRFKAKGYDVILWSDWPASPPHSPPAPPPAPPARPPSYVSVDVYAEASVVSEFSKIVKGVSAVLVEGGLFTLHLRPRSHKEDLTGTLGFTIAGDGIRDWHRLTTDELLTTDGLLTTDELLTTDGLLTTDELTTDRLLTTDEGPTVPTDEGPTVPTSPTPATPGTHSREEMGASVTHLRCTKRVWSPESAHTYAFPHTGGQEGSEEGSEKASEKASEEESEKPWLKGLEKGWLKGSVKGSVKKWKEVWGWRESEFPKRKLLMLGRRSNGLPRHLMEKYGPGRNDILFMTHWPRIS